MNAWRIMLRPERPRGSSSVMPLRLQMPSGIGRPQSWEEASAQASDDVEMTAAVGFFRGLLGEEWKGWQEAHHLARSFHTSTQGGPREWIRLYRLAQLFEPTPALKLLVDDLGGSTWRDHIAAEQALEFCGRFHRAGHRVELIQNNHERSPDTRVWLCDRPVTIEFKALHERDERAPWNAFEEELVQRLLHHGALTGPFLLDIAFAEPALQHREQTIDALLQIWDQPGSSWRDLPDGAGRARHTEDPAEAGWTIPVPQQSALKRLLSNLRSKWVRQLATADGPTLLVVLTEDMFAVKLDTLREQVPSAVEMLQKILPGRRMLSGVLLHEEPFLPERAAVFFSGEDWRFTTGSTEGRFRTALLALNSSSRFPLTTEEIDLLLGPRMCW